MTVGERIAELRGKNGLSQRLLAKKSGLTSPAVCQYESGKRIPDLKSFVAMCNAFEVKADQFLRGVDI